MDIIKKISKKLTSFQIIILGFAAVIVIGTLLLMLPISSQSGEVTPLNESLFTATSAVCVTGLVLVDTASHWSYFGHAIVLILIQIGGLGVITVASLLAMIAGKKISIMQRQTIQNSLAAPQVGGVVRLTRFIFKTAFLIEIVGALALLPIFCKRYGLEGIWMSVFHSISAFCNAGFDLMGTKTGHFSSLTSFSDSIYATVIFCFLIIAGGVGFLTWEDIATKKTKFKQYRMQSKVIIWTSIILIVVPAVIFFFVDFTDTPLKERFCASIFQAVSPRTAGFNTEDYSNMKDSGRAITMILMLIGGSPGSTAGGMKTTTIAILFANAIAVFRMRRNANYFGRRIEDSVVKNAATILFMYLFLSISGALVMGIVESIPLESCMFEAMSAIATVGLTVGITQQIGIVSQIILILLMFFGRVGGLTIIYAAFSPKDTYASKYPVENIMVG